MSSHVSYNYHDYEQSMNDMFENRECAIATPEVSQEKAVAPPKGTIRSNRHTRSAATSEETVTPP